MLQHDFVVLLSEDKVSLQQNNKTKTVCVSVQASCCYEYKIQPESAQLVIWNKKKEKQLYKFPVDVSVTLQNDNSILLQYEGKNLILSIRKESQKPFLKELERTMINLKRGTEQSISQTQKNETSFKLSNATLEEKLSFLRKNTIGRCETIQTPDFWHMTVSQDSQGYCKLVQKKQKTLPCKLMIYEDFTASGRPLRFVDNYIQEILKMYANTHTEVSASGATTSTYMNAAIHHIKQHVHAGSDSFVLATGAGVTGAIQKLQQILGVYQCPRFWKEFSEEDSPQQHKDCNVVVFVGPYEHHSNDVSWQDDTICEFRRAKITKEYDIDMKDLEEQLAEFAQKGYRILGSFSACSNVTGFKTDIKAISDLIHKYEGKVFLDYAASGPYVEINMERDNLDAVFLSPHKNLGGPGSCGILIGRKCLYDINCAPSFGGGGTVDFVTPWELKYAEDIEARETAGTPPIRAILQVALSVQVKDWIGLENIACIEDQYCDQFMKFAQSHPAIQVLGNTEACRRIPIFSVVIRHANRTLHQHLVGSLLNDLFGIQSRTGCSCAGPYGHSLLGIDQKKSSMYTRAIEEHFVGEKPGWVRIGLHYTMTQAEILYTMFAFNALAWFGHLFLSDYQMDIHVGLWKHKTAPKLDLTFGIDDALKFATTGCISTCNQTLTDTSEQAREKLMRRQMKDFARLAAFRISNVLTVAFGQNSKEDPYIFYKIAFPIIYSFLKNLENNTNQVEKKLTEEACKHYCMPAEKISAELKRKVFTLNTCPDLESYDQMDTCDESIRSISYFYVSKGNLVG